MRPINRRAAHIQHMAHFCRSACVKYARSPTHIYPASARCISVRLNNKCKMRHSLNPMLDKQVSHGLCNIALDVNHILRNITHQRAYVDSKHTLHALAPRKPVHQQTTQIPGSARYRNAPKSHIPLLDHIGKVELQRPKPRHLKSQADRVRPL